MCTVSETNSHSARAYVSQTHAAEATHSTAVDQTAQSQFDTLMRYDRSGASSPRLSSDVAEGRLTDSLRTWLETENWSPEELDLLDNETGDYFYSLLLDQASDKKDLDVLRKIPSAFIDDTQGEMQERICDLEKIQSILKPEGELEYDEDEAPRERINFLNRNERENIRKTCFSDFIPNQPSRQLLNYLEASDWFGQTSINLDYDLCFDTEEELIQRLIDLALEYDDFELFQVIPQKYHTKVSHDISLSIGANRELSQFIDLLDADTQIDGTQP